VKLLDGRTRSMNNFHQCFHVRCSFRNYQRRVQQLHAIRMIQRNGRAWLKIRHWKWWRLFTKIRPILQVTGHDAELAKYVDELHRLKVELDARTLQLKETDGKLEQLTCEYKQINERLTHTMDTLVESDEVRMTLVHDRVRFEQSMCLFDIRKCVVRKPMHNN
jgi:myosin heavy chain 9/10/11/14